MEELLEKSKKGDEQAFTELIISLESDLYKIARMRLECNDDINEAVQETIIEAFKSIKKVKKSEYFKTWLIRVLINKCNKIYKKEKRNEIIKKYNSTINNQPVNYNEEKKISELDFFILIKSLNYDERISLTLYYLEKFTTKEISEILKEPESTIRNRISRAKQKLRKIYKGGDEIE